MDLPSPPGLLRVLLLLLHFFPIASAVPSSTQPELLLGRLADYSTSPTLPDRSNTWSSFYRFFFKASEAAPSPQTSSRPTTSFIDSNTPEAATLQPSKRLLAQYGDQLVLRVNVSTELEASSLAEAADTLYLDIWGQSDNWVDIRLAKAVVPSLLGLLPVSLHYAHKPLMQGSDLARAISDTYPAAKFSSSHDRSKWLSRAFTSARHHSPHEDNDTNLFFDDYRSLSMIEHWMGLMESLFSSHVKMISIGTTYEGRNIPALRVGVHPTTPGEPTAKRETVVVCGGQHAREWISTSTVSFVAHSLITSYGKDPAVTKLLESLDFVFIPSLNPDGYQYSWDVDRLWRKNRQPTALPFCRGMDLDRSWSYMWDGKRTRDNPCSESFAGEVPFDAVEASRFADWAKSETANNNVQFVGLIDLHSYSQQILYPYAFSCATDPPTLEDLQELGQGLAKSIRFTSRESYKVISACEGNVAASGAVLPRFDGGGGSALDWFYHEMGVRKAFQIKLRDKGSYGFLLPREHIVPTGLEILNLVRYFGLALTTSAAEDAYPAEDLHSQAVFSDSSSSAPT